MFALLRNHVRSKMSNKLIIEGLVGKRVLGILLKRELCQKKLQICLHVVLCRHVKQCSVCFLAVQSLLHFLDIMHTESHSFFLAAL